MKKNRGFTLIELLIYLALFGIILGGVCGAVYSMLEFGDGNQSKVILQEEGNFLISKFDWALAGASDITIDSSYPSLAVTKYSFFDNPMIFKIEGLDLRLKRGDGPDNILNSGQTQVNNLTFQNIYSSEGGAEGLQVNFILQTTTPHGKFLSQSFQMVYYLHK